VAHLRLLEQQVVTLGAELQNTRQTCHDLRKENEALRSHQDYLQQLVIKRTVPMFVRPLTVE
jgi:cell division protein FtsB